MLKNNLKITHFVLIMSSLLFLLFHYPFFKFVFNNLDYKSWTGISIIISLVIAMLVANAFVLFLIFFLSRIVGKFLLVIFFLINAAGLIKFKLGKYQEAYDLLDKFSSKSDVLTALKYGAMADCQANLNKSDDALSLVAKAIGASDDPYTTYYFTRKAGLLALALKKNTEAKKYFSSIDEKYQDYDNGMSEAYIEMVKYY